MSAERNAAGYFTAAGITQGNLVRIGSGKAMWRVIGIDLRGATLHNERTGTWRNVVQLASLTLVNEPGATSDTPE